MINTDTLSISSELLSLVSEIDEFKGAWRALGSLAPERLSALKQVRQPRCADTGIFIPRSIQSHR